jgi:thioester reductase-like protein
MNPEKAVKTHFLTGVTGTLGRELVSEILKRTEDRLVVLARGLSKLSAEDRVRKILADKGQEDLLGTRVRVLEGEITEPDFGLKAAELETLWREVDSFFHVAALTTLNGSEEDCVRINLGGTEEALRLVRRFQTGGRLKRFYYFSTAFVAGSLQTYVAPEDALPENPAHANFYESSKYQAEKCVRAALAEGLPATIFRPSIVVGNSWTGAVSDFNVIYPFMRLYAHGLLTKLPTRLDNSFNIVPIDFVVNAALAIAFQEDSEGKTYHLATTTPPTIGTLIDVARRQYPNLPPIEIIPPEAFKRENLSVNERLVYDMLVPYLGYLNAHLSFDVTHTREALKDTGVAFPVTDAAFLQRLLDYAVNAGYLVLN